MHIRLNEPLKTLVRALKRKLRNDNFGREVLNGPVLPTSPFMSLIPAVHQGRLRRQPSFPDALSLV